MLSKLPVDEEIFCGHRPRPRSNSTPLTSWSLAWGGGRGVIKNAKQEMLNMSRNFDLSTSLAKTRNFALNLRRRGLMATIELYGIRLRETLRDWRLGIRTKGFIEANELGHGQDCIDYEPIDYRFLDIVFRHLEADGDDVFLDYGCGKGRAVITAATYRFRRAIGVELSPQLSDEARKNVERAAGKLKCNDVQIVTANAAEYVVPPEATVVFLFNPFTGSVLAEVQRRIYESIHEAPRRLRVVYVHPAKVFNTFDACPWLTRRSVLPTPEWNQAKTLVYEANLAPEQRSVETRATTNIL